MVSYSAGISAFEKGGEWERALSLLSLMPRVHVSPNQISYNACIGACEKSGSPILKVLIWTLRMQTLFDVLGCGPISPHIGSIWEVSSIGKLTNRRYLPGGAAPQDPPEERVRLNNTTPDVVYGA